MIRTSHVATRRRTTPLILLALVCAFCFGAMVRVAVASSGYHVNCVGHGFVHGASLTDGSFFSRVEAGCGSTLRSCDLYTSGVFVGGQVVTGTTALCNAWSRDYGSFTECASEARVASSGVFAQHVHTAVNWCG